MIASELIERLEAVPGDTKVVVASPDFLPFSRSIAQAGTTKTDDGGRTVFVVLGGGVSDKLPTTQTRSS